MENITKRSCSKQENHEERKEAGGPVGKGKRDPAKSREGGKFQNERRI